VRQTFRPDQFTATGSATTEEKAKWANQLVLFVLGGYQEEAFNQPFYQRMRMMFGFIAHDSRRGFYYEYFSNQADLERWLKAVTGDNWLKHLGGGDPHYTWGDVEATVGSWLSELLAQCPSVGRLRVKAPATVRAQRPASAQARLF